MELQQEPQQNQIPIHSEEVTPPLNEVEASVTPMDEAAIEALSARMRKEARKARNLRRYQMFLGCFIIVWFLGCFLADELLGWKHAFRYVNAWQVFSVANWFITAYINSESRKKAVRSLAKLGDVRAVGPLADVLAFQSQELQKLAADTLSVLLPRLQATDSVLLNTEQRQRLHGILMKSDNRPLILAILKALEQVGDSRDISAVQALADGKGKLAADSEVHAAALSSLPYLQANVRREQASQTLLRASSPEQASPDSLLRPVQPEVAVQPEQLLRAASPDSPHGAA